MPSSQDILQLPSTYPAHQVIYGGEYGPQTFWSPSDGIIIRGARPPSGRGVLSSHRPAGLCAAAPDDDQQTAALPTFHQHHPSDDVDMMVEQSVMLPSFRHQSSPSGNLPRTVGFSSCANSGMMAAQHVDSSGLLDIASLSLSADSQSAPCDDSATTLQQQQDEPSGPPTRGHSSIFVISNTTQVVRPKALRLRSFSMTSIVQSRSVHVLRPMAFHSWQESEASEGPAEAAASPQPPAVVSTGGPLFSVAGSSFRRTISSRATEETPIGAEGGGPPQTDKMSVLFDAAVEVLASMKDKPASTKTEKAICKAADIKCHCCKKLFAPSTQKKYLCARRICSVCSQASRVLNNDGKLVRYCQLCKWTHSLERFIGQQSSCKPELDSHQKRRRERNEKREKEAAEANASAPAVTQSQTTRRSARFNTKKKARHA